MNLILIAVLLTGSPETATPRQAHTALSPHLQTGTLIVSQGDCLAIKIYSASAYTHVAAVVVDNEVTKVYESTGGAGVRRQLLADYLVSQNDHTLHVFHPRKPFTAAQADCFEKHLEAQLGRPYAIRHHLTGERCQGLHCSEYVTDALISADLLRAKEPPRVSPATLVEGILKADLYEQAETLELVPEPPPRPESAGWCAILWFDTKQCTRACYYKLRGWFCCK
jgi:hypothetical protein